jgi:hypothetical protein
MNVNTIYAFYSEIKMDDSDFLMNNKHGGRETSNGIRDKVCNETLTLNF